MIFCLLFFTPGPHCSPEETETQIDVYHNPPEEIHSESEFSHNIKQQRQHGKEEKRKKKKPIDDRNHTFIYIIHLRFLLERRRCRKTDLARFFASHIITFCSVKIAGLLCVNISLHVKLTGNAYSGFSTVFCAVGGNVKKILLMCVFQDLKPLYSFLSQYSLKASVKTTVIAFGHVM